MTATHPPKPRPPRRVLWISIAAGLVLAVGAVAAGYAVGAGGSGGEAAEAAAEKPAARPEPEASAPSVPLPEPSEAPASVIPAECSGIYSVDWSAQLDGYVLNPAWTTDPQGNSTVDVTDEELNAIVQAGDPLRCQWGHESGGSDRSLRTVVVTVTAEQSAAVLARLQTLGLSCYEELGGTRCVSEESDDNGTMGESHFVREGVWIATRWMNMAPDGYTHDIVSTLWP